MSKNGVSGVRCGLGQLARSAGEFSRLPPAFTPSNIASFSLLASCNIIVSALSHVVIHLQYDHAAYIERSKPST